jgi:hypothetical protein
MGLQAFASKRRGGQRRFKSSENANLASDGLCHHLATLFSGCLEGCLGAKAGAIEGYQYVLKDSRQ